MISVLIFGRSCDAVNVDTGHSTLGFPSYFYSLILAGYPPFCSESPQETYHKVMHWRQHLIFPPELPISDVARDLILSLCIEADHRLGIDGVQTIKDHKLFKYFLLSYIPRHF